MLKVFPFEGLGIGEYSCGFLERNTMFLKVPGSLASIPDEHNLCIYTNS